LEGSTVIVPSYIWLVKEARFGVLVGLAIHGFSISFGFIGRPFHALELIPYIADPLA